MTFDKMSLIGQIGDGAGVFRTLTAQSVKEVRPGVYVYDMGQNIVRVPRVNIANGHPGARITFRFAEILYPDLKESGKNVGMVMTENYRAALNQDVYTWWRGARFFSLTSLRTDFNTLRLPESISRFRWQQFRVSPSAQ